MATRLQEQASHECWSEVAQEHARTHENSKREETTGHGDDLRLLMMGN